MRYKVALGLLALASSSISVASSGALDSKGCHNDPVTGKYHCHTSANELAAGQSSAEEVLEVAGTDKPDDDRMFKNCSEVRAAHLAPITKADPGYARHLDPDGDGIGCE